MDFGALSGRVGETLARHGVEPIFVAYAALIAMAVAPIYAGSKMGAEEASVADGGEAETLSKNDAYWFPVMGSGVLFGLYLVFRYVNKDWVNLLLTAYFAAFGAVSLTKLLAMALGAAVPARLVEFDWVHVLVQRKTQPGAPLVDVRVTWLNTLAFVLACGGTAVYVATKHWVASNVFAVAFATSAIQLIQLDSFATGMILLGGLFAYDIFWVFGTDVMVTVAKSFNAPVKLLFPRDVFAAVGGPHTMLGLGDIVIPGVVIALCLRFDQHNAGQSRKQRLAASGALAAATSYPTPYFTVALCFYVAGLVTTMAVMHTFKAAQPALLYLSPAGILAVLLTALVRREVRAMFAFSTEPEKPKDDDGSDTESLIESKASSADLGTVSDVE
jgi:minor histocompatibility antigen H13